ncbi:MULTISPECIES: hypothetical protein [unclassified Candidatus Frackibacter]|uniref:hypothetical protein n=1 Tax=unclassified Candidatus Frackibacter TaxID=2648818 RepID=UPI00087E7183|nr:MULTISPECIES: hypothetical protein [unclassified Candidatus Frackibacter]SDC57383.1 hypothetical protein SAMN04515661_11443 [Candidatus Frackibacter sp. WG11]SEM71479.1 hypothetical protein SAMN04488698_11343 [Candidatus Frackibacter sp. WG12]SFL82779.1 hypothetical protein SAMN04488699_11540 [Candidatus Frackibacter sp. WG13]
MSKLETRSKRFQIGDLVVKLSETKELYFRVVDIKEDIIKINAINLPISTYVKSNQISKANQNRVK